ncbi:heterokaryon incompatibility protein-domain-containing protein [Podospora aff. communis PSN243]|uniref:Heterokaryon incompatibility protein-domain-containing protein n=1 Tax=Podospora aff. communis PSN243 TaxID=3040156 RepID=A0AAV9H475_9PEZI|nr:heterokaryon incompatibility protein-domain-containing protein [Podospora aff. communis PSN243]
MATTHFYARCPLGPEADAIRLLRLHPSRNRHEPLVVTIFSTNLSTSKGLYEVLSYCWGTVEAHSSLTVELSNSDRTEQFQVSIAQSLADVLTDLRLYENRRVIWADAICINQSDNDEKSTQVAQMFDVYHSSRRTVAYLGPDDGSMQAVIAFRDYLCAFSGKPCARAEAGGLLVDWDPVDGIMLATASPPLSQHNVRYTTSAIGPDRLETPIGGPHSARRSLFLLGELEASIKKFFSQPWFTRAWTTQEFVAGPDVILQIGKGSVHFELADIQLLVSQYYTFPPEEFHCPKCRSTWFNILTTIRSTGLEKIAHLLRVRDGEYQSIAGIIHVFLPLDLSKTGTLPWLGATDPRDILWALLGMSSDRHDPNLQPDYTLTVEEVYMRYSRHMANFEDGAFLLEMPKLLYGNLPSWAIGFGEGIWTQSRFPRQMQKLLPYQWTSNPVLTL